MAWPPPDRFDGPRADDGPWRRAEHAGGDDVPRQAQPPQGPQAGRAIEEPRAWGPDPSPPSATPAWQSAPPVYSTGQPMRHSEPHAMGDEDALVDGDVRPPRRGRGRTLLTVLLAVGFIALAGLGGYAAALMVSRSAAAPTPSTMLPTATATATVAVTRSPATSPSATAAASRTPTPSRTPVASPSSAAPASPGSTPTIHTVAPGETLTAIARRYGVTVAAIVEANDLANPNSISVGQKLTIPPKP